VSLIASSRVDKYGFSAIWSVQRIRFQLRRPSDSEGGVCCNPSWAASTESEMPRGG
jgi:hypothetical protein